MPSPENRTSKTRTLPPVFSSSGTQRPAHGPGHGASSAGRGEDFSFTGRAGSGRVRFSAEVQGHPDETQAKKPARVGTSSTSSLPLNKILSGKDCAVTVTVATARRLR